MAGGDSADTGGMKFLTRDRCKPAGTTKFWSPAIGVVAALALAAPATSAAASAPDCSTVTSIPTGAAAGVTCTVASESDLASILERVDTAYAAYVQAVYVQQTTAPLPSTTTIDFTNGIQLTSELPFVNGPVVINGEGFALSSAENSSGVPQYRGFLLYNSAAEPTDCGNSAGPGICGQAPSSFTPITVENLTIADTAAVGGNGGDGAGGGAGLGGAIFVGHGVAATLSGDTFSHNSAVGGGGGLYNDPTLATGGGGGGGMGGAGGNGSASGFAGGGGGLGVSAFGANGGTGSGVGGNGVGYALEGGGTGDQSITNLSPVGANAGGLYGGGGGGGGTAGDGGGGGGLNAGALGATSDGDASGASGGVYGIGGGGGGGSLSGGYGGLGGGEGFRDIRQAGGQLNGFGGGAAGPTLNGGNPGSYVTTNSNQGFAAGSGVNNGTSNGGASAWLGGGGAGLGGAVFVQMGAQVAVTGTLAENGASVAGGKGACAGSTCAGNGSGYGSAIFLQGDGGTLGGGPNAGQPSGSALSFSPAAGQTETIGDGIAEEDTYDGDGRLDPWTLTLNGAGTLELAGSGSFGATQLNAGTLVVPASATLASSVTINSGASMILAGAVTGKVTLNPGGSICAAQLPANFTNNGGTITTSCTTPPTVAISAPGSGGTYTVNQAVTTSFNCAAGTNSTLTSCKDSNGVSGSQGTLNTSTPGVFTYTVTATDADGKTTSTSITYTVSSPCQQSISYGLVQLTVGSGGCLQPSANGDTYSTPGPLTMNGLTLPALPAGAVYVASEPTAASPGGSLGVQAPGVSVNLGLNIGGSDGVTFNVGPFNWNLPAAPAGGVGSATVQTLSLAPAQLLKGMQIGGSAALAIGKDASGAYYTSFTFTVDLPKMFKSGPSNNAAGLTGTASVRVDAQGAHFNGLAIQVSNAYVGTLQVKSACFAYSPDGSAGFSCPQPAVPATPLGSLTCANAGGDNWSGSADIVLPTSGAPELSLYGSVAGGSLSELGATANNLKIELADDVFLNEVGLTLCLPSATQPLAIQGTVQLGAITEGSGYLVNVNGSFDYQDPSGTTPWEMGVGGEVTVGGDDLGSGAVSFYGDSYLYFEVNSNLNLANIASIQGGIEGWLETQSPYQFNVQGDVSLNIKDIGSFSGSGAVSSKGVAGCATVGGISYWEPEKDSDWVWYEPWKIHWVEDTVNWQAGFGYYWGASSPSVWATSCDIGNYELATPAGVESSAVRQADISHAGTAKSSFTVANANAPMAVKIAGVGGAPRVKLTSPGGRLIEPPAGNQIGEKIPGVGMELENRAAHATMLLLTSPAAGGWHVSTVSGSVPLASIRTAGVVPPPEVVGSAKALAGGRVGVGVGYSLAAGEKMTLYATGPRHEQQVIGVVKGKPCPGGAQAGPSSQLCAHVSFAAAYGPSGKRTILGAVTNAAGLPVSTVKIASVQVHFPKPEADKPVLVRNGDSVQIKWMPVSLAPKYAVSVVLGDGSKLAYTTRKTSLTLNHLVDAADTVSVTVWPVMPDGEIGESGSRELTSNQSSAGVTK
jgi:hypothetical protein